jgi:mannose-6-phosphate isomerase-like protein (cupin superfamily)
MDTPLTTDSVVLDADAIADLPAVRLKGLEAARSTLLWRSKGSAAGVMNVDPGGRLEPHCHGRAAHHMWVLNGHATVLGQPVGPGAYVHVPAGVDHGVTDVGPEGCGFLYLYIEEPAG